MMLYRYFEANPGCSSTTCTCSHSLFISKNRTIHSAYYWLPAVVLASSVAGLNGKAARNTSAFTNFDMNVLGNFLSSLPAQRKTEHQLGLAKQHLALFLNSFRLLSSIWCVHRMDEEEKRKNLEVDSVESTNYISCHQYGGSSAMLSNGPGPNISAVR